MVQQLRFLVLPAILLVAFIAACGEQTADQPGSGNGSQSSDALEFEVVFTSWFGEWEARANGVAQMEDGGWLVACTGYEPRGYGYGLLVRVSPEGTVEWTRDFYERDLDINDILLTNDGNFILAGSDSPTWDDEQTEDLYGLEEEGTGEVYHHDISADYWVYKVSAGGDRIWSRSFSTPADEYCNSVMECSNGDLAFAGTSFPLDDEPMFRLVRTDPEGAILWDKTYGFPEGQLCDHAILTSNGSFLLGGTANGINTGYAAPVFVKIDPEGVEIWLMKYGQNGSDHLSSFVETPRGNIAAVGRRDTDQGSSDAFLTLLDTSGEELWTKCYPSAGFNDIAMTDAGEFLVSGSELWKIDTDGDVLLTARPLEMNSLITRRVLALEDGRILLIGSAWPPSDSGITAEGFLGFLSILD